MIWDIFIVLILILSSIWIPFILAFEPVGIDALIMGLTLIMDIFLCIDIFVTFRTAIYDDYDPLILITCPITIAKAYIRFWFFFDLITSFPFDFIIGQQSVGFGQYLKILRLIRFIRIFRIIRVLHYINVFHMRFKLSPSFVYRLEICKIMFAMAFISHLFACLWYAVGIWETARNNNSWIIAADLDDHNISLITKYSTSMYWSVITLFTTGYGDITANNTSEQWVAIFCVCVGSCVSAWFIGTFSALVLEGDSQHTTARDAVEKAFAFCNHFKFDDELQRAIVSHTKYYYHYNYVTESKDEVMHCLPLYLQNKIKRKLATRTLRQNELFKHLPREVIGQLVLKSKSVACNAGYCLFKTNENASELYVCTNGECILSKEDDDKHLKVKRGDIVGEYCLLDDKRKYTLLCNTWSEFWVITKQDIYDGIESYYGKEKATRRWAEIVATLRGKRKRRKLNLVKLDQMDSINQLSSRGNMWKRTESNVTEASSLDLSDSIHANTHDVRHFDVNEEELKHTEIVELAPYHKQQDIIVCNGEHKHESDGILSQETKSNKLNKMSTFLKIFKQKKKKKKKKRQSSHSYSEATQQSDSNSNSDHNDSPQEARMIPDPCTQSETLITDKTNDPIKNQF